jgi:hypothetical protein
MEIDDYTSASRTWRTGERLPFCTVLSSGTYFLVFYLSWIVGLRRLDTRGYPCIAARLGMPFELSRSCLAL